MQFQQPIDARAIDPCAFQPIPSGDYRAMITASEAKATAAGDGSYLEFTVKLLEGPGVNREFPYRLNLWNKNEQAVRIAFASLSAICHVTGVFNVTDSQQLHGQPFLATIGLQKSDPNYNEVKGVKHLDGSQPGKQGTTAVASAMPTQQAQPMQQPATTGQIAPAQQPQAAWGQQPLQPAQPAQPQQGWPQQAQPAQPAATPWGAPPAGQPPMQPQQQQAPQNFGPPQLPQQPQQPAWGAPPPQQAMPPQQPQNFAPQQMPQQPQQSAPPWAK